LSVEQGLVADGSGGELEEEIEAELEVVLGADVGTVEGVNILELRVTEPGLEEMARLLLARDERLRKWNGSEWEEQ
jgi:hypothetical protein